MSNLDIARALKDREYFDRLTEEEKAQVRAADPTAQIQLDDDVLDSVSGGLSGEETAATGTGSAANQEPGGGESTSGYSLPCVCNC